MDPSTEAYVEGVSPDSSPSEGEGRENVPPSAYFFSKTYASFRDSKGILNPLLDGAVAGISRANWFEVISLFPLLLLLK
jgi:hypothetical protein